MANDKPPRVPRHLIVPTCKLAFRTDSSLIIHAESWETCSGLQPRHAMADLIVRLSPSDMLFVHSDQMVHVRYGDRDRTRTG